MAADPEQGDFSCMKIQSAKRAMQQRSRIDIILILRCFLAVALICMHLPVKAEDRSARSVLFNQPKKADSRFFTLTLENDIFVNEDDGYTNGLGLTYGRGPFLSFNSVNTLGVLLALSRKSYINTMPNKVRGIAYMFFQRMQTPTAITLEELQEKDIPYAGLLALQTTLYAWDSQRTDQLSFYIGAVGPATLGEHAQKNVHTLVGADKPEGWDHQINNEPVFKLEAQRVLKLYQNYGSSTGFDVLGIAGVGLGNLESATKAGVAMRLGSNLEYTHATFSLQSDRHVNSLALSERNDYYAYMGARIGIVFNDILIDGNTFSKSHSVPLEHVQNQVSGGVVWKYGPIAYVFQLSSFSSRTTLTSSREKHGAVSLTYTF